MFVIRDLMHCKPGKVRPMVQKFQEMNKLTVAMGLGAMRVMTDIAAERYWTVVTEVEVDNLTTFDETSKKMMADPKFQEIMKDYHDLVQDGRREIYRLEK